MHLDLQFVRLARLIPGVRHGAASGARAQPIPAVLLSGYCRLGKVDHDVAGLVLYAVGRNAESALEGDQHTP